MSILDELSENYFTYVQNYLRKNYSEPYTRIRASNEDEYLKMVNQWRLEFLENDLWHRHILTIHASDNFSRKAKAHALSAWFDYVSSQHLVYSQIGYYSDTDKFTATIDNAYQKRSDFIGVMEALGYNLVNESEQIKQELASSQHQAT